eukprot:COSAG06_NODE_27005_length_603_cov_0.908730_2_plen_26_part_01
MAFVIRSGLVARAVWSGMSMCCCCCS